MKKLWLKFVDFLFYKKKKMDEISYILKEINSSLKSLEQCVGSSSRSYGKRTYLVTGHWND